MADGVRLRDLRIETHDRVLVEGVSLQLQPGCLTVLVGASGSGKSLTARSLLGLVGARPGVTGGELEVEVDGNVHRPYTDGSFTKLRGGVIGWLPQDARGALNPLWSVGRQVREALRLAGQSTDVTATLTRAGFQDPERVACLYPHELSGGMAQRACIALALARGSRYLLADEPTTGLDPTVQEGILDELVALKQQRVGILLITHDLRLVPRLGDRLLVMATGRLVEDLPAQDLQKVSAPEARQLLEATRRISGGVL